MAKYLITGGCGFIGSHLCQRLSDLAHEIIVLDISPPSSQIKTLNKVTIIQGDIRDTQLLNQIIPQVDGCFHLAAVASVALSAAKWSNSHQINGGGTIALLETIKNTSKKIPFIYASSAAVYGASTTLPLSETTEIKPTSVYGIDKYCSEMHAILAANAYGIPTVGLRLFNVYGPNQKPDSPYAGVISIFIDKISDAQSITIYGDGTQTRDFIYIDDVVNCFIKSINLTGQNAKIINVCTGNPTSINQLGQYIANILGNPLNASYQPKRIGDIQHSYGNSHLAQKILDLKKPIPLTKGLKKLISVLNARQARAFA